MRFKRRAWGWYFVILDRKHFKVKLLRFKKGGGLSLQYHVFRNELWVFLSGRGRMQTQINGNNWEIGSGHYYTANTGDLHKYSAITSSWILEIQYGEKCDETDIVRI